jgi:diacylglycerol kinase family enzyme
MDPQTLDPRACFFIVLNERSGHHDADDVRAPYEQVFARAGRAWRWLSGRPGQGIDAVAREAVRLAREQGGVVVAAGGDGTLNAVAQATLGSGRPFGVLPRGTFNYFSREHGIPAEPESAAELLISGRPQPVQVGLVNERAFLVNASLGLYPKLLEDREAYKRQLGRSRPVALLAGLATLFNHQAQLRLRIEHREAGRDTVQELRTPTLFVGNNRLQLDRIGIDEAPLLERGQLAALTLKPVSTLAMLGLLWRGALGRLGEADTVQSFASRQLVVRPWLPVGARRIKVATDGEIAWMRPPLRFAVAPEPLMLIKSAAAATEGAA